MLHPVRLRVVSVCRPWLIKQLLVRSHTTMTVSQRGLNFEINFQDYIRKKHIAHVQAICCINFERIYIFKHDTAFSEKKT